MDRVVGVVPRANVFVITTQAQLQGLSAGVSRAPGRGVALWQNRWGRDTAAATGLALLLVKQRSPQGTFAMLPADHVIHDTAEYQKLLQVAFESAESVDVLVTLGIQPAEAATGFGYIRFAAGPWKEVAGRVR